MKKCLALICCALVVGCSTFKEEYSCGKAPQTTCASVSSIYEETSNEESQSSYVEGSGSNAVVVNSDLIVNVGISTNKLNQISPGEPLLTKPVIMRVLFRSFENNDSDLDAGGFTFLKMRESEWVLQK